MLEFAGGPAKRCLRIDTLAPSEIHAGKDEVARRLVARIADHLDRETAEC